MQLRVINPSLALTPTSYQYNHENFFSWIHKSSIWGACTAPGAPETTPKGGALRAPSFEVVSGAPGAVQTPKIDNIWAPAKIQVHDYINTKIGLPSAAENRGTRSGGRVGAGGYKFRLAGPRKVIAHQRGRPRRITSHRHCKQNYVTPHLPSLRTGNKNDNVYLFFCRFPAELGPETRSYGSGSKNGAERTPN